MIVPGFVSPLAALKQQLFEARARELEDIPKDSLAWLALPPFWTVRVARAVGFPTGKDDLDGWLERLEDAQLVAVVPGPGEEGEGEDRRFQLPGSARATALVHLREQKVDLVRVTVELGRELRTVEEQLPPVIKRFLALARKMSRGLDEAASWLRDHVRELCDHGHAGDALDWIDSAEKLATGVGGSLVTAVRLSRYRTERAFRQEQDRTYLTHFLARREQLAAFEQLVTGPDEDFALHYLGMGGVGKTMLIRHIAAESAPRLGVAVARVDFDYLSPAYPATEPGHLIGGFLVDLLPAIDEERQEHLLRTVQSQIVRLHERLRDDPDAARDPLAGLRLPELDELLAWFAELITSLGKVVLVLDTCEELTKVPPVKGLVPAVEASFALLERLHDKAPSLRVVFAGRRLLTRAGRGWRADEAHLLDAPLSAPRPYLALHALRGFDAGEADAFLDRRLRVRKDDRALREAIFAASPDEGEAARLLGVGDDVTPRCSPFNLELHADWVERDPRLSPADLRRRDIDPYIEMRIVRRIGALEPILPHVALLRRFEARTLAPAATAAGLSADETIAQLAALEWIDVVRRPDQPILLGVRRQLQERLLRCLAERDPGRLATARGFLAPELAHEVSQAPLARLEPSLIDAALRLASREDGALLWSTLEDRVAHESAWDWMLNVTRVVTAPGGAAESPHGWLAAAVRASQASALVVSMPGEDAGGAWDAAMLALGEGEEARPLERRTLRFRVRLGQLAATVRHDHPDAGEQERRWQELAAIAGELVLLPASTRPRLAGGVLAACEALVEAAELTPWRVPAGALPLAFRVGDGLQVVQDVLELRLAGLRGPVGEGAWRVVLAAATSVEAPGVLDWCPPASLRERVRLEATRALFYTAAELPEDGWAEASRQEDGIDGDRLRSALLERRLSRQPVAFELLFAHEQLLGTGRLADLRPQVNAHLRFPPLFVTVALGWIGRGDSTRPGSLAARAPEPWAGHILRALFRRLRLGRSAERLQRVLAERAPDFDAVAALAVNTAIDGKDLAFLALPARLAVSEARDAAACQALVDLGARRERPGSEDPLELLAQNLVALELAELSHYTAAPRPVAELWEVSLRPGSARWAEELAALLRLAALTGGSFPSPGPAIRAAALVALSEGELLARRLPARAVPLLVLAADWFSASGDTLGAWQAILRAAIAERHAGGPAQLTGRLAELTRSSDALARLQPSSGWHARHQAYLAPGARPPHRVLELHMHAFARGEARQPSSLARVTAWTQRNALTLLTVLVALAAIGGALYAVLWLYVPWARGLSAEVGLPAYVIGLGPLVLLLGLTRVSRFGALAGDTLDLVGGAVRLFQRGTQAIAVELAAAGAGTRVRLRHRRLLGDRELDSPAPAVDDGAAYAVTLGTDLTAALARLQRRRFGPRLPTPLVVPRAATGACVEAWLAGPAATPGDALLFYRRVGEPAEPVAAGAQLDVLAPPALVVDVRKAWGAKPPPIMHLVARAVRTARGAAIVQVVASASQATRTVKLGDEVTWLAEDVDGFAGRLLVLQAEPDESVERTGADRRSAAVGRELAASFMDAGAAAVLVVPALPRSLGLQVIAALARSFGSRAPDRVRLLAGLRRARELVAGETRLGSEPMWDVTLFLRE